MSTATSTTTSRPTSSTQLALALARLARGSLLWLALSGLFALYASFAGSHDRTYGSVAGAIVLLLWLSYSAWAILFGAELNAELERQADIRAAGGPKAGLVRPARRAS